MGIKDLIVTPVVILICLILAYIIRPWVTDEATRKYFFWGFWVRIIGALSVGLIYQFYYQGGDTFNLFFRDVKLLWEAFLDSPMASFRIVLMGETFEDGTFKFARRMITPGDPESFLVVRFASLFGYFTLGTYSAIAVLFAAWSFSGLWALFRVFVSYYPSMHRQFAIAILFIPSVFFWGSGLLKDTLTLGAMGWLVYGYDLLQNRRQLIIGSAITIFSALMIYYIKIYILLCLLPALLLWSYAKFNKAIRPIWLKILTIPVSVLVFVYIGYNTVIKISEGDPRYAPDKIAETAFITAYDIGYFTGRGAGSGYSLGELDGTVESMARLAPAAINVSLFRPYIWEVNNPLMLLSAIESLMITVLTIMVLYKCRIVGVFSFLRSEPIVLFCLVFSIIFAFGVGISTYNFGSLARYRIPLLPFYVSGIFIIFQLKRSRKFSRLLDTE